MRGRASSLFLVLLGLGLVVGGIAVSVTDDDDGTGPTRGDRPARSTTSTTEASVGGAAFGAAGVGDPYFPGLGNGGYDVQHYDLDLEWLPDSGELRGVTEITATALEDLGRLNLDLAGLEVRRILVDGTETEADHVGRELEVTLPRPVATGDRFVLRVQYQGTPEPIDEATDLFEVGWQTDGREAYVVSEPSGAATFFPVNDHPSDKATYTFRVQAPPDQVVAANGLLVGEPDFVDEGGGRVWTYEMPDPMASYLVQIAIGDYELVAGEPVGDVQIRHAFHRSIADAARDAMSRTGEMLSVLTGIFGPYPFDVYGVLAVDEPLGFALETQTLTIVGSDTARAGRDADGLLVHELAHQWVGNAVSPSTWKDIWLNEGFATYAEWLWAERTGGPSAADTARRTIGMPGLEVLPGDPGPDELFSSSVYFRGALTLQALRETIGDDAFFGLLRAWIEQHRDEDASTEDLIELAEERTGQQLDELFEAWLYTSDVPELDR